MRYDDEDDFNALYDDRCERYGDPCPGCGTLRWQGDCGNCIMRDELGPGDKLVPTDHAGTYEVRHDELAKIIAEGREADMRALAAQFDDDDIPF